MTTQTHKTADEKSEKLNAPDQEAVVSPASQNVSESLGSGKSLDPAVCKTTANGTGVGIDRTGYINLTFYFYVGTAGDTLSGSVKIQNGLEESSDSTNGTDGNWTAVDSSDVNGAPAVIDASNKANCVQTIDYIGDKKWVRPKSTFTGTHTNGTPISVLAVGKKRNLP